MDWRCACRRCFWWVWHYPNRVLQGPVGGVDREVRVVQGLVGEVGRARALWAA